MGAYPHWSRETVIEIAAGFADHWHAAAGASAAKLDWPATWRNWCRNSVTQRTYPGGRNQAKTALTHDRTAQADRLMGSYAAELRAADAKPRLQDFIDMEGPDARLTDG